MPERNMADIVTKKKLEDADIDVDNLGKAANELGTVNPRYGNPYKTAPQTIQDLQQKADQVVAQGFYQGYATEALLLAAKPAVAEMRARADDTRKVYRWNRTSAEGVTPVTGIWTDTGLSDLDQSKKYTIDLLNKQNPNFIKLKDGFKIIGSGLALSYYNRDQSYPALVGGSGSMVNGVAIGSSSIFVADVEPNKTYTLLGEFKYANNKFLRAYGFPVTPVRSSFADQVYQAGGQTNLVQVENGAYGYIQFTTSDTVKFLAVMSGVAETPLNNFALFNGAYEPSMLDVFKKEIPMIKTDSLYVKDLKTDSIVDGKNLFPGYSYGYYKRAGVGDTYGLNILSDANYGVDRSVVATQVKVKPNTTYTISKELSSRFAVALVVGEWNTGQSKFIFDDPLAASFTFTTELDTTNVFIYLSNSGEHPLVQIEEGSQVTTYESPGVVLKDRAKVLGKTLLEASGTGGQVAEITQFYDAPLQTNKYNNNTLTSDQAVEELYGQILAEQPHYAKRNLLGKDQSGLYDIYEYIFEPEHYEQTVFITAGMHPREHTAIFALGLFMQKVANSSKEHWGFDYLRRKIRFVFIPILNPWGFNQNPRTYGNSRGINPSRNWPDHWEQLSTYAAYNDTWNKRGTEPFSEAETRYMRDVLQREKNKISFALDLHMGNGLDWTHDTLAYFCDEDKYLRPVFQQVIGYFDDRIYRAGRTPFNLAEETARATNLYYVNREMGIPAATIEYSDNRPGGDINNRSGSIQLRDYLELIYNHILNACRAKLHEKVKYDRERYYSDLISFNSTFSAVSDISNMYWNYTQLIAGYDALAAKFSGITKTELGDDASGTQKLYKYVFSKGTPRRKVLIIGAIGGQENKSAAMTLAFLHNLYSSKDPKAIKLRNEVEFTVLPCGNPWGFNQSTRDEKNSNNVDIVTDFASNTPQVETVLIKSLIASQSFDYALQVRHTPIKPNGYADIHTKFRGLDNDPSVFIETLNTVNGVNVVLSKEDFSDAAVAAGTNISDYLKKVISNSQWIYLPTYVTPKRETSEGIYKDIGGEMLEVRYITSLIANLVSF
jgi:murein tripeptide amidase MpaA